MTRSGVVLAGGASRRFGGDKLAEPIDGIPLLERSIAALAGLVDEIIVVVAPNRSAPRLPTAGTTPIRVVADPEPFGGPLVGLRTGLEAARGTSVLVVGGDMPSMRPAVLELLLARPSAALGDQAGVLRPLPCSLDRAAALLATDALLAFGERRLRALLTSVDTTMVPWRDWQPVDPSGLTLVDIDERSDLP
jgi:molybdopterin-guanine dinucleotide biosynthesis protein A